MGFYYNQQPGFYYNQQKQQPGFYYNQKQEQPGFYYNQQQQQPGFYYNQQQQKQQGFYYGEQKQQGFYYDGFYYDQPGFYYDQQKGFYYDGFYYDQKAQKSAGFYYDQQDTFNKENKDYWYKGDGTKRMVAALDGLRTLVDNHVTKNPHAANATQGRAITNVVTVQVVREVIKKFVRNVDPESYFKNGGDAKKLATLLAKECQSCLGPGKITINYLV